MYGQQRKLTRLALYIGMGDGGFGNDPENRAQNVDELLGKILRIDVDKPTSDTVRYSSPTSNPFSGATPGRDEIYALGFRNPWRFSFDRNTGELYAGDVGEAAIEEIDIVTRGGNYGWRVFEGTRCTGLGPASCSEANFVPARCGVFSYCWPLRNYRWLCVPRASRHLDRGRLHLR